MKIEAIKCKSCNANLPYHYGPVVTCEYCGTPMRILDNVNRIPNGHYVVGTASSRIGLGTSASYPYVGAWREE